MNGFEGRPVPQRMPDGKIYLTVPEAVKLWRTVGSAVMTERIYRRQCRAGELQEKGIAISEGPRFMTDLDSLLAYFDRELQAMRDRLDGIMETWRRDG